MVKWMKTLSYSLKKENVSLLKTTLQNEETVIVEKITKKEDSI